MNTNLINITDHSINGETVKAVSARELHQFLGSNQDFSTWIKARIETYSFVENQDYIRFHKKMEANNATLIEYAITIDMAKELSMVERTPKGKQARQYFIACEKKLREVTPDRPQIAALEYVDRITARLPNLGEAAIQQLLSEASEIDLGRRLIPLPVVVEKFYTATELAEELGVSAQKVGRIANAFGLKTAKHGEYRLSKSKHSTKQVEQFYYNEKGRQALALLFSETMS